MEKTKTKTIKISHKTWKLLRKHSVEVEKSLKEIIESLVEKYLQEKEGGKK